MSLSRDDILNVKDLELTKINIPEWGGDVYVSPLTGSERDLWEGEAYMAREGGEAGLNTFKDMRARMVVRTVCNEQGERLFKETDIHTLGGKNAGAMSKIFNLAMELSGITEADIEELTKN